jgi:hypothetical protein
LSTEAKESAYFSALSYLKDNALIVVKDTNFANLNKYTQKLKKSSFGPRCAMTVFALKEQLSVEATSLAPFV